MVIKRERERERERERGLVGWKQLGLEGCQCLGHGSLHRQAVPLPVHNCEIVLQKRTIWGSQFCSMGQGTGVEGQVLGVFWAGLVCWGCDLCSQFTTIRLQCSLMRLLRLVWIFFCLLGLMESRDQITMWHVHTYRSHYNNNKWIMNICWAPHLQMSLKCLTMATKKQ